MCRFLQVIADLKPIIMIICFTSTDCIGGEYYPVGLLNEHKQPK